jgi:hypothetical protein
MMKFGPLKDGVGLSLIVKDFTGKTLEKATAPEGFPPIY